MKIGLFFAVFLACLAFTNTAHSLPDESELPEIDLYVPEYMIVGYKYNGMLVHSGHGDRTVLGILAANPDAMSLQDSTSVLPYEDHGIFDITPLHAGIFSVSVKVDGHTIQKSVTISEGAPDSSLLLVLPEKTRTGNILGAVYLVDEINQPILAQDTLTVSLDGTSGITLPETVTINPGSTGAVFAAIVDSSGFVSASSGKLHDSVEISAESEKTRLVMDVYPKIMQENSFGYYFLWFEDDEGNPHIPSEIITALIHSSEKKVARMELKITGEAASQIKNTFSDGVTYGKIFTGISGRESITASVAGYGSATSEFVVGPAEIGVVTVTSIIPSNATNGTVEPLETTHVELLSMLCPETPTDILFGIIPPKTVTEGYVIAGLYHTETKESTEINITNVTTIRETSKLCPVPSNSSPLLSDAIKVYITSNGAKHVPQGILDAEGISTHVNLYEIGGTPGEYTVSVSSPQMISQEPEKFAITGSSANKYYIEMMPLPAIAGHVLDLALVYVTDSQGVLVDPKDSFGAGITIHLESESVFLSSNFLNLNEPVGIIRGAYSEGSLNQITAYGAGLERVSQRVGVSPDDSGIVLIDTPSRIHSDEPFAASAHLLKDSKAVTHITDILEAGGGCQRLEIGIFSCSSAGVLSIFSDIGSGEVSINPYLTKLAASFQYSFNEVMSVGKNYTVIVSAPVGTKISADTAINHTISGDTITLSPNVVGDFEVTLTASRSGMSSQSESISVTVDDLRDVTIMAKDSKGVSIGVDVSLVGNSIEEHFMTDHTLGIPRSSVTVEFPKSARHGDFGYRLVSISHGAEQIPNNAVTFLPDHDNTITANYERVILIDVINGTGSGVYGVGETVTISAQTKYTLAFLLREVLDSWSGIDSTQETVRFIATEDLTLTATYRTDYTGAVAVFVGMGVIVMAASFRGNQSYLLRISQITDRLSSILGVINHIIPKRIARTKKLEKKNPDKIPKDNT